MAGIKPPSPPKIWRFSSAHFYRKVISEKKSMVQYPRSYQWDSWAVHKGCEYCKYRCGLFQNSSAFLYSNGGQQYFLLMAALQGACHNTIFGELWGSRCKQRS